MSKYTKEILEPIVKSSNYYTEVLEKLGLKISGGNSSHIKKRIVENKISTEHFLKPRFKKGNTPKNKRSKESFIKNVLCKNGIGWGSHRIKLALYEFKLKKEKCEKCSLENLWNGEKLSLHLEHIDGDKTNNNLQNLKILCPNCHSQTDTYAGKRNKKLEKTFVNFCCDCYSGIGEKAIRCKSCASIATNSEKRDFIMPKKEDLIKLLKLSNFVKVGEKYGVSDNAVRKWCKKYNISTKSKDY